MISSFKYFIKNIDMFLEETLPDTGSRGKTTASNGKISEHAFHHGISMYMDARKSGKSHEEALDHVYENSENQHKNKKSGGSEEMAKHKSIVGESNFRKLYSDSIRSSTHFLHHLHNDGFEVSDKPHATGAAGEKAVEAHWGVKSNADLIVPVKNKNTGEEQSIKLKGSGKKSAGASLKVSGYGDSKKKSSGDKLRSHGLDPFHKALTDLVTQRHAALGTSPDSELAELNRKHQAVKGSLKDIPKEYDDKVHVDPRSGTQRKDSLLSVVSTTIKKTTGDKVSKTGRERISSIARKLQRGENSKKFDAEAAEVRKSGIPHPKAKDIIDLDKSLSTKKTEQSAAPEYFASAAASMNKSYQSTHPSVQTSVEKFHHALTGVARRKSKERNTIRTFHVSINNTGENNSSSTKIVDLSRSLRNAHDKAFGRNKKESSKAPSFVAAHNPSTASFNIKSPSHNDETVASVSSDRDFIGIKAGSALIPPESRTKPNGPVRYYKDKPWESK